MKIIYSPKFAKEYKKLPINIKLQAEKKESLFRENPYSPSLKTHKLSGELEGRYSFSINYQYRIIFRIDGDTVYFIHIGTHEIYK